jgi:hypothetical protein
MELITNRLKAAIAAIKRCFFMLLLFCYVMEKVVSIRNCVSQVPHFI